MGENMRSPSMQPHADRRPTYNGVQPGSPRGTYAPYYVYYITSTIFIEPCLHSSLTSNDYMHVLWDSTNHDPIMKCQQVHIII